MFVSGSTKLATALLCLGHAVSLATELAHLRSLLLAFFLELVWLCSGSSFFSRGLAELVSRTCLI